MRGMFKNVLWYFLVAAIAVAVFRGIGDFDNIWPWMTRQSGNFEDFIKHLVSKLNPEDIKPLDPIIPLEK